MKHKERHWAVLPGVVVASLAALGALGTAIVKSATYLTLPERVEATERKNESQDKQLDRLITLQEYYAQQPRQATPHTQTPFRPPPAPVWHPDVTAGHSSDASPEVEEVSDGGEIKVMVWTDEHGVKRQMCCQGTTCWPWTPQAQCER